MKNVTEFRDDLLVREGGKRQVSVAQMTEIVACISDLFADEKKAAAISKILTKNGKRRLEDKNKRRPKEK